MQADFPGQCCSLTELVTDSVGASVEPNKHMVDAAKCKHCPKCTDSNPRSKRSNNEELPGAADRGGCARLYDRYEQLKAKGSGKMASYMALTTIKPSPHAVRSLLSIYRQVQLRGLMVNVTPHATTAFGC